VDGGGVLVGVLAAPGGVVAPAVGAVGVVALASSALA
jgi:hypothetical protein